MLIASSGARTVPQLETSMGTPRNKVMLVSILPRPRSSLSIVALEDL